MSILSLRLNSEYLEFVRTCQDASEVLAEALAGVWLPDMSFLDIWVFQDLQRSCPQHIPGSELDVHCWLIARSLSKEGDLWLKV